MKNHRLLVKLSKFLLLAATAAAFSASANAAEVHSNSTLSGVTDWMENNLWVSNTVPGTHIGYRPGNNSAVDNVTIGRRVQETITLTQNANSGISGSIGTLAVGARYGQAGSKFVMSGSASLKTDTTVSIGEWIGGTGIEVNGGLLSTGAAANNISISVGFGNRSAQGNSYLKVSGNGRIETTNRIVVGDVSLVATPNTVANSGYMEIIGSQATVSTGNRVEIRGTGSISFTADTNGFGKLTIGGTTGSFLIADNALLSLDLTAYAGGDDVVTLIDAAAMGATDSAFGVVAAQSYFTAARLADIISNAKYDATKYTLGLAWDSLAHDLNLTITAAIPEPGTYAAILGMLALTALVLRRRRA